MTFGTTLQVFTSMISRASRSSTPSISSRISSRMNWFEASTLKGKHRRIAPRLEFPNKGRNHVTLSIRTVRPDCQLWCQDAGFIG